MIDRNKVQEGVKCCMQIDPNCNKCPYDDIDLRCISNLRNDVISIIQLDERLEDDLK